VTKRAKPRRPEKTDQPTLCAALRQELARLQRELNADPRYLKVKRIEALLEVYEAAPTTSEGAMTAAEVGERMQHFIKEVLPPLRPAPSIEFQNIAFDQSLDQPGMHEVTYEVRKPGAAWTSDKRTVSEDLALKIQDFAVANNFVEVAKLLLTP
jgi:hypothetical protein